MYRLLAVLLLLPTVALAGVGADFTYDDQGQAAFTATAYNLYMDGDQLCSTPVNAVTVADGYLTMACEAEIPVGVHLFTLTASLPNGGSSPHSNAFQFYQPPPDPGQPNAPVLIRLRIEIEGAEYTID